MKINRIYALVLRYFFNIVHSYDRLGDIFYWPTIDLFIWGLTSLYLKTANPNDPSIIVMIISGLLFWSVIWQSHYEITINMLLELWDRNLINLFASPLKFSEWIVSVTTISIIRAIISLSFAMTLAFILYKVSIFFYGPYLIIYFGLLIMTGWWVGFFLAGVILRYGTRLQFFGWSTVAILSPFSAIYYPLSTLPGWAQKFAAFLPTSYIFEGAREILYTGYFDANKVIVSFCLNCIYLVLAIIYINLSFKKTLERGLVKLN